MKRLCALLMLIMMLAACQQEDNQPVPTRILDLTTSPQPLPQVSEAVTPAALRSALPPTWTPIPTITLTPTPSFTPSLTPSDTPTLSAIQQTEVYLFSLRTAEAETATARAPTLPPLAEVEVVEGLLPGDTWQRVEIGITTADLQQIGVQLGLADVRVALNGLFFTLQWRDGVEQHQLVFRQDALNGVLLITPISYQINRMPADLAVAEKVAQRLRDAILARTRPAAVYYLDAIHYSPDAAILHYLYPPE